MQYVAAMNASLVEVDTLVVGVVGIMDTVESVLFCVGVVFGLIGYMGFEQDSSCSSVFVAPIFVVVTRHCWRIFLLRVAVGTR